MSTIKKKITLLFQYIDGILHILGDGVLSNLKNGLFQIFVSVYNLFLSFVFVHCIVLFIWQFHTLQLNKISIRSIMKNTQLIFNINIVSGWRDLFYWTVGCPYFSKSWLNTLPKNYVIIWAKIMHYLNSQSFPKKLHPK